MGEERLVGLALLNVYQDNTISSNKVVVYFANKKKES